MKLKFTAPLQLKSRKAAGDKDSWLKAVPEQCLSGEGQVWWQLLGRTLTWGFAGAILKAFEDQATSLLRTSACLKADPPPQLQALHLVSSRPETLRIPKLCRFTNQAKRQRSKRKWVSSGCHTASSRRPMCRVISWQS